jgi:diguanylate cyclase (GGDEF)-like protein/PAS domain S-box-containing protein
MADKRLPNLETGDYDVSPRLLELKKSPTETIDLMNLMSADVTASGSFDLSGVETTSLGKLLHALPIPALLVDRKYRIVFCNDSCGDGVPCAPDQGQALDFLFPRTSHSVKARELVDRVFQLRKQQISELLVLLGQRKLWCRISWRPIRVAMERYALLLFEDLTLERKQNLIDRRHKDELKKAHGQLEKRVQERTAELLTINDQLRAEIGMRRKAQAKFKLAAQIIESSNEAILLTDLEGKIVHVNSAFSKVTGYTRDEVLGQGPAILTSGGRDTEFYKNIWQTLIKTGEWQGEVWDRRKNGVVYPKLLSLSAVKGKGGEVTHYVGIFSDITKIKQTEQRLQRLAHFDPLTELPNRVLFHERLHQALVQARREKNTVAVMLLDLDRFKSINDTLGHRFGDRLLVSVADRISESLRRSDTAARLGGDEFTVMLPRITDAHAAAKVARKIIDVLSKPFALDGREVFITTSIGITLSPDDGTKVERLLQNADTALYYAKERGKNNFQFFSREMNLNVLKRLKLETTLRNSMTKDKFLLHYQPMVDAVSGRVVGMEALLRWQHARRGSVSAAKLIPVAEETGLILPIGEWVLRTACKQNREWQRMGFPPMRVAVNFSGRQLKQSKIVDTVLGILEETGLDPGSLEIELTETVMMEDVDGTIETLQELKRQGIQISIDDFGTGYSSLNYLRKFPIDKLKIDQSFVKDISSSEYEQEIIKAVLAVAHSRDLKVIAEGVETGEQLKFLRQHGCDQVQGFYVCPPISVDRFTRLLQQRSAPASGSNPPTDR